MGVAVVEVGGGVPSGRFWGLLKSKLIRIATLDSTPRKVACAVGVGMFVGMLPITGFQIWTGVALSFLLRVNRVGVVLSSQLICNPLTLPFIFFFNIKVGERVLGYEQPAVSLTVLRTLLHQASFRNFLSVFAGIAKPLYLGAIVVAPLVGLAGFSLATMAITAYRKRRLA